MVGDRPASVPRLSSSEDSALSSADTDTASGGSPATPNTAATAPAPAPRTDAVAPRRPRRDEYDSSATETADEENDAPSAKVSIVARFVGHFNVKIVIEITLYLNNSCFWIHLVTRYVIVVVSSPRRWLILHAQIKLLL